MTRTDFQQRRRWMVVHDLADRGIRSQAVLDAMTRVPRELFVPPRERDHAYDDGALPIDAGQTISQPYIVGLMTEAASVGPGSRVLEIGTGSGYQAAVLAELGAEVWTIERHESLTAGAAAALGGLGYCRVHLRTGDGTLGWPEEAPFDAILVTAGAPTPPQPLLDQLAEGGRLVIPVGRHASDEELLCYHRIDGRIETADLGPVRFVPLVGAAGWPEVGR